MLEKNFCSSPWFHIRIDPTGQYLPCRWGTRTTDIKYTIANTSIIGFMQSDLMNYTRQELLNGNSPPVCQICQYEQSAGKVSGRQKQLLKSGIIETRFDKTFCSSPHWDIFKYSYNNHGKTKNQPVDLQIDLGNTCNSACIMCDPKYSSRLGTEYKQLHKTNPILFKDPGEIVNWTQDQKLIDKFVEELNDLSSVKYIHFIGGETLYMQSFYDICNRMIDNGTAKDTIIGTTTNCTLYDQRIEHIIKNFKEVHLGLSIETVTSLNDYIRYPSDINNIIDNVKKFLKLRESHNIFVSLRITPNLFSVYHLDKLFEFMLENNVTAESCNILYDPSFLRMELLPDDLRQECINKLNKIVGKYKLKRNLDKIINRRLEEKSKIIIGDLIFEYIDFLSSYNVPDNINEDYQLLIKFLHAFQEHRNNDILTHLPEYEEFLRSIGY